MEYKQLSILSYILIKYFKNEHDYVRILFYIEYDETVGFEYNPIYTVDERKWYLFPVTQIAWLCWANVNVGPW